MFEESLKSSTRTILKSADLWLNKSKDVSS